MSQAASGVPLGLVCDFRPSAWRAALSPPLECADCGLRTSRTAGDESGERGTYGYWRCGGCGDLADEMGDEDWQEHVQAIEVDSLARPLFCVVADAGGAALAAEALEVCAQTFSPEKVVVATASGDGVRVLRGGGRWARVSRDMVSYPEPCRAETVPALASMLAAVPRDDAQADVDRALQTVAAMAQRHGTGAMVLVFAAGESNLSSTTVDACVEAGCVVDIVLGSRDGSNDAEQAAAARTGGSVRQSATEGRYRRKDWAWFPTLRVVAPKTLAPTVRGRGWTSHAASWSAVARHKSEPWVIHLEHTKVSVPLDIVAAQVIVEYNAGADGARRTQVVTALAAVANGGRELAYRVFEAADAGAWFAFCEAEVAESGKVADAWKERAGALEELYRRHEGELDRGGPPRPPFSHTPGLAALHGRMLAASKDRIGTV